MKIVHNSITLADATSGLWAEGLAVNGSRAVQVAQIIRATSPTIFTRQNRQNVITFGVTRLFATFMDAEVAATTAMTYHPESGVLSITAGEIGESTQAVAAANCVLTNITATQMGKSVKFQYSLTAGDVTTSVPPTWLNGTSVMTLGTSTAIGSGLDQVVITFSTPFGAGIVPICAPFVRKAASTDPDIFLADIYNPSNTGFTAYLSGTTGNANYRLDWTAIG